MYHPMHKDTKIALLFGIPGGIIKFFHEISQTMLMESYSLALLKAGFMAMFIAMCSVAGKHLYTWLRLIVIHFLKNKNKQT